MIKKNSCTYSQKWYYLLQNASISGRYWAWHSSILERYQIFFAVPFIQDAVSCDQIKILKVNTVVRADVSTDQPYARNL